MIDESADPEGGIFLKGTAWLLRMNSWKDIPGTLF
jgi:hypothetical protein